MYTLGAYRVPTIGAVITVAPCAEGETGALAVILITAQTVRVVGGSTLRAGDVTVALLAAKSVQPRQVEGAFLAPAALLPLHISLAHALASRIVADF